MIPAPATSRTLAYHQLIAILLVFFAFFMAALVSRSVFERLPHLEDEVAYLFQAKIFERGNLVIDSPTPARAYWQPFVVDYQPTGKRFGKYTPGWPALLALGVNFGQPWVINALFAGLSAALVYRLGREIFNPDVGVIAAALTAFSSMALLLNGTLMGHTAALCFTLLFMYAYWRMEKRLTPPPSPPHRDGEGRRGGDSNALRWGILAGFALGMVVVTRPLTALGIAAPFVLWSGVRLATSLLRAGIAEGFEPSAKEKTSPLKGLPGFATMHHSPFSGLTSSSISRTAVASGGFWRTVRPLLALGAVTLVIGAAIPIFNHAATGDAIRLELYTLVWSYDKVGFGEGIGRHGHTLEKGLRQTRWDLSLTAADLFGWQIGPLTEEVREHLLNDGDYYPNIGLSFALLPLGLLVGFRRLWAWVWVLVAIGWLLLFNSAITAATDSRATWLLLWSLFGVGWLLAALGATLRYRQERSALWTWLLLALPVCLIAAHVAYWIGSQRYSTRYYFEGLGALAILSALPLAWLARRWRRWPVYVGLAALLAYSLYAYGTWRISVLYRFNFVGQDKVEGVKARAPGDAPVLVIVSGAREDAKWRAWGSLMALTSPYLDSPIVAAWDYAPGDEGQAVREKILARFPDRQIVEMAASGNDSWFVD